MRRGISNTNLTKSFILSKLSQELIFSKYLGIDIDLIYHCIETNELIHSPFREEDINPSCGFQYNNKMKLKCRDFGGYFWGDCFDLVADIASFQVKRRINVNNKQDFYFVLKHIAYTFKNIIYGNDVDESYDNNLTNTIHSVRSRKSIIEIIPRAFNKNDRDIWSKWGIDLGYLSTSFVYPVEQYYINRSLTPEPKYYYRESDPCYAYVLGQDYNGFVFIKLYFPLRDRKSQLKFITNCNILEGLISLEEHRKYDIICITKSSKDRLSMGNHFYNYKANYNFDIGFISLPSENYKLTENEYIYLNGRLKEEGNIISFTDFDRQGISCYLHMRNTFDIPGIFITNGKYGTLDYGAKDFAELKENYSDDTINEFINETLKYLGYD